MVVCVEVSLTKAEAMAVLRSQGLSNGYGVRRSQALQSADEKLIAAVSRGIQAPGGGR